VEIEVDRALADAGAHGNVVELGGRETLRGELFERGVDDGDTARLLLEFALAGTGHWSGGLAHERRMMCLRQHDRRALTRRSIGATPGSQALSGRNCSARKASTLSQASSLAAWR